MEKRNTSSVAWVYWVSFGISLAIVAVGLYLAIAHQNWVILATGSGSMVVVLVTWPLAMALAELNEASVKHWQEAMNPLNERMEQLSIMLNLISEQQLFSDRTKSVIFREKDREALRRAIQEELARHDYEAADSLADEMEKSFGYRQEAERLRLQINDRRGDNVRRQINEVMGVIERFIRAEKWAEAHKEAEKLGAQFPDHEQVRNLPNDIDARREQHKKQLLDSWHDAVTRRDTDGAIEILKKLDAYLSPAEAESMQETARGIFKMKLENLRAQFAIAVQNHSWQEAIRVGDIIIRDFPNTQMAKEAREAMDVLRKRASEVEPANA